LEFESLFSRLIHEPIDLSLLVESRVRIGETCASAGRFFLGEVLP